MAAMVPMTLRGAEKGGDVGNQVGATMITVHTDIADPVERLLAIRDSAQASKRMSDAIGRELMRDLLEFVPHLATQVLSRYLKAPRIGLIVSNVRGPDVPLYMAGAQLVNYAPISIPADGMGLNVTGFSYSGTMWICATSCREMLPDPAFFAACLRGAFEDLKQAAARITTVEHPKPLPQLPGSAVRRASQKQAARKKAPKKAARKTAARRARAA
jgi:hypothetical protein